MYSEFTMIPSQKKCPLCGGEFFHLLCDCEDFDDIDIAEISKCFLLEEEKILCNLSCYFRCEQKNIVIDFADSNNCFEDVFNCCTFGEGNSVDKLNDVKRLMQLGYYLEG